MSPFKEGIRSPMEPDLRDAFAAGALSRFEAPPSPKHDSLSPTPLIGEPQAKKSSSKRASDPKTQSVPGEFMCAEIRCRLRTNLKPRIVY